MISCRRIEIICSVLNEDELITTVKALVEDNLAKATRTKARRVPRATHWLGTTELQIRKFGLIDTNVIHTWES